MPKRRAELEGTAPPQSPVSLSASDGARRNEILDTAARLFGSSGFRTSLQEIADACGIKAGSLYHHFESKEAIVIELVKRYQAELDAIAKDALDALRQEQSRSAFELIVVFAERIAACAIQHRAALLQTLYHPSAGAHEELVQLAKQTPRAIDKAMLKILQACSSKHYLRPDIDLTRLAEQICQSMLHTGVGMFHSTPGAHQIPSLKCRMLLDGLVIQTPDNAELDRSAAFKAADKIIAGWTNADEGPAAVLRAAARTEFGRRGYEATTIRDIAAAAGMSTGMVYRLVGSKDELLTTIMSDYIGHVTAGWDAVMASKSTPVEKLDALMWLDINVLDRFTDEFKIQLAWLRQSPPTAATVSDISQFNKSSRHMKALLTEGEKKGFFRVPGASVKIRAHCLLELTWISENIVRSAGPRAALGLARDTLLRGAAQRG